MSVLLPAPFSPSRPTTDPGLILKVMSWKTCTAPNDLSTLTKATDARGLEGEVDPSLMSIRKMTGAVFRVGGAA